MTSRTYLSIGDVLTLLREEFPDVTISKIRFLESQGLVNPERSPSGYRKFFEHDVERLRWVLRQQREHFLPLKVIRDRLAGGEVEDGETSSALGTGNGNTAEPATESEEVIAADPAPAAAAAVDDTGTGRSATPAGGPTDEPRTADDDAMARILADASRRAASLPDAAQTTRRGLAMVTDRAAEEATSPPSPPVRPGTTADPRAGSAVARNSEQPAHSSGSGGDVEPEGTAADQAERDAGEDAAPPPPQPKAGAGAGARKPSGPDEPVRAGTSRAPAAPAAGARPAAGFAGGMATGASFTAAELCAASGLSREELAGLESFGLVRGTDVAGMVTYDEEALAVANMAAAFRAYGVEPRHLRLYRNAADREIGLIEQVVMPLLRQRNPESRQRAAQAADQLATLGQSLRASLVRVALRRHLGG